MTLPNYSVISGTKFRVGFGPRGTFQRLIITQVHVDRLAKLDGKIVVEPDHSRQRVDAISPDVESRHEKIFRIPWQLKSEADVALATREALLRSHGHFANRVAFTPLGVTDDGIISPDQSARSMLGAIYALWSGAENTVPHQILISIHADSMAYQDFKIALGQYFFPHRQAENPNTGLVWKSAIRRWGVRNWKKSGQNLLECLESLSGDLGREAALTIHEIAQKQPGIFKAKDIDLMSGYEHFEGISETLLILRQLGGRVGEAARLALVNREKAAALDAVRNEMEWILEADEAELAKAIPMERAQFLETMSPNTAVPDVYVMCSGEDSADVRCNYSPLWGRIGTISWEDDSGRKNRQFISFHKAVPVTRSRINNELYTMGMRVANREEAERILRTLKVAVLARYGRMANAASHLLDGSQEWFLNLCAEYRDRPSAFDQNWHVASLPEDIGRGTLYLHFQNHAESDRDSHRVLRILAEDFGLTFISPRKP